VDYTPSYVRCHRGAPGEIKNTRAAPWFMEPCLSRNSTSKTARKVLCSVTVRWPREAAREWICMGLSVSPFCGEKKKEYEPAIIVGKRRDDGITMAYYKRESRTGLLITRASTHSTAPEFVIELRRTRISPWFNLPNSCDRECGRFVCRHYRTAWVEIYHR